jgi:hypothetical protein
MAPEVQRKVYHPGRRGRLLTRVGRLVDVRVKSVVVRMNIERFHAMPGGGEASADRLHVAKPRPRRPRWSISRSSSALAR